MFIVNKWQNLKHSKQTNTCNVMKCIWNIKFCINALFDLIQFCFEHRQDMWEWFKVRYKCIIIKMNEICIQWCWCWWSSMKFNMIQRNITMFPTEESNPITNNDIPKNYIVQQYIIRTIDTQMKQIEIIFAWLLSIWLDHRQTILPNVNWSLVLVSRGRFINNCDTLMYCNLVSFDSNGSLNSLKIDI